MIHNVLEPLVILGTIGASIILFTRTITNYILKKKMIEKGFVNEESQSIFKKEADIDNKYASLKWGLIVFFGGASLVVMEFISYQRDSTLPYGLFALAVSLGFLIYYFVVKSEQNK
jgi:hypothetical protein